MPHFVIEISENLLEQPPPVSVVELVYQGAVESELFNESDVKVRLTPYRHFLIGPLSDNKGDSFIHINDMIIEG
ncbi:hypothetical protein G3R49_06930 [Shewanella sp. WXL01]|uniref:5-carboxymethyl-2-hydroxymuconate Delta-isomerase n=1 Tax=Shewanella sp. WXL01 TaxID=2709721 RepID=UPI0014385A54|nr:hypothetical protein [Shewanella sp. WXL01]NKF50306.1 hypothetical protein [Shewanella sp. WXL01]